VVGQRYWEKIAKDLTVNLRSTNPERAIALAVEGIGKTLKKHFPADLNSKNPNELSDDVTRD
jgi:uncharacterized membrane protein